MSITQKPFGIDQIGRQMTLYTMTNKIGFRPGAGQKRPHRGGVPGI